jgi:hypothetical protein
MTGAPGRTLLVPRDRLLVAQARSLRVRPRGTRQRRGQARVDDAQLAVALAVRVGDVAAGDRPVAAGDRADGERGARAERNRRRQRQLEPGASGAAQALRRADDSIRLFLAHRLRPDQSGAGVSSRFDDRSRARWAGVRPGASARLTRDQRGETIGAAFVPQREECRNGP